MNKLNFSVLIVDDMRDYRDMFSLILQAKGYNVIKASCIAEAINVVNTRKVDIIVTDLIMKNETGIQLLKKVKGINPSIGVIVVTAYGTIETAVEAIKLGAYNYFIKSSNPDSLIYDIEKFLKYKCEESEVEGIELNSNAPIFKTKNKQYKNLLEICEKVAKSNISVLILGESGVGKEVVARYIHDNSLRKHKDFVAVNCQEYSEGLIESELFGHEKGAFTGAIKQKKGKFEMANGGTLFLDEIADVSLNTQVKLLRVLENNQFERVGGCQKIKLDARLISATNKDLDRIISDGKFREDFLYRLNGIMLRIPPLRERIEDLEMFIEYFTNKISQDMNKQIEYIDDKIVNFLRNYDFPGNIRELRTIIERLIVLSENGKIEFDDVKYYLPYINVNKENITKKSTMDNLQDARNEFEEHFIKEKILKSNGNLTKASKVLGISTRQLHNKIVDLDLKEWLISIKEK
ncbi:sigma-54-dependent transcriptional regulator [Eubacteriales bacterium KG127]